MSRFILASASPRRKDLLGSIGYKPDAVIPADIDETPGVNEAPGPYALRVAEDKAFEILSDIERNGPPTFILAADTVVAVGRRILPKTEDENQARFCLERLSGRQHRVYGGVCVVSPEGRKFSKLVTTYVRFKRMTAKEIERYLKTGEWEGVAGGYAIQGYAQCFIKKINGSYSNIVGLSLYETKNLLTSAGYRPK